MTPRITSSTHLQELHALSSMVLGRFVSCTGTLLCSAAVQHASWHGSEHSAASNAVNIYTLKIAHLS